MLLVLSDSGEARRGIGDKEAMKQTRLYDRHVELGGRMVPFADYELPVQYTAGPNAEHRSVRTAAGVFDIDHMGQFALSGEDALAYLQYVQRHDRG